MMNQLMDRLRVKGVQVCTLEWLPAMIGPTTSTKTWDLWNSADTVKAMTRHFIWVSDSYHNFAVNSPAFETHPEHFMRLQHCGIKNLVGVLSKLMRTSAKLLMVLVMSVYVHGQERIWRHCSHCANGR